MEFTKQFCKLQNQVNNSCISTQYQLFILHAFKSWQTWAEENGICSEICTILEQIKLLRQYVNLQHQNYEFNSWQHTCFQIWKVYLHKWWHSRFFFFPSHGKKPAQWRCKRYNFPDSRDNIVIYCISKWTCVHGSHLKV